MRSAILIALVLFVVQMMYAAMYDAWYTHTVRSWILQRKVRGHVMNDAALVRQIIMREFTELYGPQHHEGFLSLSKRQRERQRRRKLKGDLKASAKSLDPQTLDDLITRLSFLNQGVTKEQIDKDMYASLKKHQLNRARDAGHDAYGNALEKGESTEAAYTMGLEAAVATVVPEAFAADKDEEENKPKVNASSVKVKLPNKKPVVPMASDFKPDINRSDEYANKLENSLLQYVNIEFEVSDLPNKLNEIRKKVEAIPMEKPKCIYAYSAILDTLDFMRPENTAVNEVFRTRLANFLGHYFSQILTINNDVYNINDLCDMVNAPEDGENAGDDTPEVKSLDACLLMNNWRTKAQVSTLDDYAKRGLIIAHLSQNDLVKSDTSQLLKMPDDRLFAICNDLVKNSKANEEENDEDENESPFKKGENYQLMESLLMMLSKVRNTGALVTNAKNNAKTRHNVRQERNSMFRNYQIDAHKSLRNGLDIYENGLFTRYKVSPVK